MSNYNAIREAINKAHNIILFGHVLPDGDCIGSVLAVKHYLNDLNKNVYILSQDKIPRIYHFLPGVKDFIYPEELFSKKEELENCDLIITLDVSVRERVGEAFNHLLDKIRVVNIDHHVSNNLFGSVNLVEDVSSAGEIIYHFLKSSNHKITKDIATCLYTSIITDTGSFRYEKTSPNTHLAAAELISAGADTAKINQYLFEEKPLENILLLAKALQSLKLSECKKVAWIEVLLDDLHELKANDEHLGNIINYTRSIEGVEIGILFRELSHNKFKVGFRSKSVDVNNLANKFGGGGHPRASGCIMEGDLNLLKREVISTAVSYLS